MTLYLLLIGLNSLSLEHLLRDAKVWSVIRNIQKTQQRQTQKKNKHPS